MKVRRLVVATKIAAMILFAQSLVTEAAEIRLIAATPMTAVINDLAPQFERATRDKVVAKFVSGPVVKREIDAGEAFDLAISITPVIDALIKEGKIVASTRADIAYSGVGLGVRAGHPSRISARLRRSSVHSSTRSRLPIPLKGQVAPILRICSSASGLPSR